MNKSKKTLIISVLIIMLFSLGVFLAKNNIIFAGTLNNASSPASTLYTLTNIYNRLTTNDTSSVGDHDLGPASTPASSGYSLTDIYEAIPSIDASKVVYGTTYLGVAGTATTTVSTLCYDTSDYHNSITACSESNACDSVFNGTYTADGIVVNEGTCETGDVCYDGSNYYSNMSSCSDGDDCDSDIASSYSADGEICNAVCVVDGSVADGQACCNDANCESVRECIDNVCSILANCGDSIIQSGEICDSNSSGACTNGEYYGSYPCLEDCSGYSGTCGDPLYIDEARTQPANPPTDLAISYDEVEQVITLTWEDRGYDYEVYQTDKPTLNISTWTLKTTDEDSETAGFQINVTAENGFFTVVADDDTENIVKLGYFVYDLIHPEGDTGYNQIGLCLDYGINTVTELGQELGLEIGDKIYTYTINHEWNCSESTDGINWEPNYTGLEYTAVKLEINNPKTSYLTGEVPDDEVSFDLVSLGDGSSNFIYLPLSKYDAGYDTTAEIGEDMGHNNAAMVCRWDQSSQSTPCAVYLNTFEAWLNSSNINTCEPLMIGAEQSFTWPQ